MVERNDLLIIAHLRKDARMSLTKLSKKTNIPASTVYDKIKEFKDGHIKKHTAFVDFQKLGYQITAFLMIQTIKDKKHVTKDHLEKHVNVNSLFKINNNYDFFVEAIFRDINELEEFKEELEIKFKTRKIVVYHLIKEIKKESFLSNPEVIDLFCTI